CPRHGLAHSSPFTIHHSPFTIHHSPFTIHHSPFTTHPIRYSLFASTAPSFPPCMPQRKPASLGANAAHHHPDRRGPAAAPPALRALSAHVPPHVRGGRHRLRLRDRAGLRRRA